MRIKLSSRINKKCLLDRNICPRTVVQALTIFSQNFSMMTQDSSSKHDKQWHITNLAGDRLYIVSLLKEISLLDPNAKERVVWELAKVYWSEHTINFIVYSTEEMNTLNSEEFWTLSRLYLTGKTSKSVDMTSCTHSCTQYLAWVQCQNFE